MCAGRDQDWCGTARSAAAARSGDVIAFPRELRLQYANGRPACERENHQVNAGAFRQTACKRCRATGSSSAVPVNRSPRFQLCVRGSGRFRPGSFRGFGEVQQLEHPSAPVVRALSNSRPRPDSRRLLAPLWHRASSTGARHRFGDVFHESSSGEGRSCSAPCGDADADPSRTVGQSRHRVGAVHLHEVPGGRAATRRPCRRTPHPSTVVVKVPGSE